MYPLQPSVSHRIKKLASYFWPMFIVLLAVMSLNDPGNLNASGPARNYEAIPLPLAVAAVIFELLVIGAVLFVIDLLIFG